MKILALGDFNGKFPKKYENIIKKEKIDLVVSNGDYPSFSLKEEFFKYVYGNPLLDLWDFIGKKRYREAVIYDHKKAEDVMKKLNKLPVPVFTVLGNHDYPSDDVHDREQKTGWEWADEEYYFISRILKKYKNIKRVDYKYAQFKDFVFIGARGHSYPGHVKSRAYKRYKKKLEKLFNRFKNENKQRKVIFISHNSPYNTKLDLITSKDAHKRAKGKHYGSKMFRRIIDKYQPVVSISGHIDESMGKQKIGKTMAVNCGPVHHGKGAVIEINDKGVVSIKFL